MEKLGSRLLAACLVLALIVTGLGAIVRPAYALTDLREASYAQSDPPVVEPAIAVGEDQICKRVGNCLESFLNIVLRQGNAHMTIANSCTGDWRHVWRQRDAHQTIRQWHDDAAAKARGSLCIPLHPDVNEIRVTSTGGHCGFLDGGVITVSNEPGSGGTLKPGSNDGSSLKLEGCHAATGNGEFGTFVYGGIALDFSDGYGFGDAYLIDNFYGVYDALETSAVTPLGASIYAIRKLNTYHYRVEILAKGRSDWRWSEDERDGQ